MDNRMKNKLDILIVTGGYIDKALLLKLVEEKKDYYIIGVDKGLEALDANNIVPDLAVGDFDSADIKIREKYSDNDNTILLNPVKDSTDTHVAVTKALKLKPKSIAIVGATGKRIDHMLGNIGLLKICLDNGIDNAFILDNNNKIRIINKDTVIRKKELYGEFISLIPFTDEVSGITLEGFKYSLRDGILIKDDTLGISNELVKEEGLIKLKSGSLLLLETKD